MRLIDVEELERLFNEQIEQGATDAFAAFDDALQDTPTVDAEVVVRCKDCPHFKHYGKTSLLIDGEHIKAGWCYRRVRYNEEYRMPPDGFCSYGERKEGADNG